MSKVAYCYMNCLMCNMLPSYAITIYIVNVVKKHLSNECGVIIACNVLLITWNYHWWFGFNQGPINILINIY